MQPVHLVRAKTDDGEQQLWLAATDRAEAIDRVLSVIPEGWVVSLVYQVLGPDLVASLAMKPGEVRRHQMC